MLDLLFIGNCTRDAVQIDYVIEKSKPICTFLKDSKQRNEPSENKMKILLLDKC